MIKDIQKLNVPKSALLPKDETAHHLAETGALWYCADRVWLCPFQEEPAIQSWDARVGRMPAYPTRPNNRQSQADESGQALRFLSGIHCGFSFRHDTGAGSFSALIRYQSAEGDAQTLLNVMPDHSEQPYLFVAERDKKIILKPDNDHPGLEENLPQQADGWRLVLASWSEKRLWLAIDHNASIHSEPTDELAHSLPGEVFIGCRSHRAGLLKTLGPKLVSDVLIWPDINILHGSNALLRQKIQHLLEQDRKRDLHDL